MDTRAEWSAAQPKREGFNTMRELTVEELEVVTGGGPIIIGGGD